MKTVFQHFSFCFSCSFLLMFSVKLSTLMASSLLDGEGNGNPLRYSCLENPRGGGAWWAAVYGVA